MLAICGNYDKLFEKSNIITLQEEEEEEKVNLSLEVLNMNLGIRLFGDYIFVLLALNFDTRKSI